MARATVDLYLKHMQKAATYESKVAPSMGKYAGPQMWLLYAQIEFKKALEIAASGVVGRDDLVRAAQGLHRVDLALARLPGGPELLKARIEWVMEALNAARVFQLGPGSVQDAEALRQFLQPSPAIGLAAKAATRNQAERYSLQAFLQYVAQASPEQRSQLAIEQYEANLKVAFSEGSAINARNSYSIAIHFQLGDDLSSRAAEAFHRFLQPTIARLQGELGSLQREQQILERQGYLNNTMHRDYLIVKLDRDPLGGDFAELERQLAWERANFPRTPGQDVASRLQEVSTLLAELSPPPPPLPPPPQPDSAPVS